MKSFVVALLIALTAAATLVPDPAYARRFGGGGGGAGMQRSLPPRAPDSIPARPSAQPTTPATAAAAAAAPRRSWLGPIAGLAAGLGLAALFSHLGLGEGLANFVMLALLVLAAIFVVRFLMRRFAPSGGGMKAAFAGASGNPAASGTPTLQRFESLGAAAPVAAASLASAASGSAVSLPAGFDATGFERIAKMIFIRLQAANDAGDLNDLRRFTTPEMFAAARIDLQDRGATTQRTDVVQVDAEVLDVANETDRQIVSVRFHGLIREEDGGVAEPFDEVWHLVKPTDGSAEWAIAGIQQSTPLARAA